MVAVKGGGRASRRYRRALGNVMWRPEMTDNRLGPFRVLELLARGSFGEVYLAKDHFGQRFALKLLAPSWAVDEEVLSRFERECRSLALLNHTGIVQVYGVGRTPTDQPYLAMEYVDGPTMREALDAGLPETIALDLLEEVADALGYVHDGGLVHRDVKPSNVILGSDGRARLTDFGTALPMGEERLTKPGDFLGTPAYMAPEQVSRTHGPTGPWTDVFGLGIVLYEILTGETPWISESSVQALKRLIRAEPVRPPRQIRPTISVEVERVCLKALNPVPVRRYTDAGAFLRALRKARTKRSKTAAFLRRLLARRGE